MKAIVVLFFICMNFLNAQMKCRQLWEIQSLFPASSEFYRKVEVCEISSKGVHLQVSLADQIHSIFVSSAELKNYEGFGEFRFNALRTQTAT